MITKDLTKRVAKLPREIKSASEQASYNIVTFAIFYD